MLCFLLLPMAVARAQHADMPMGNSTQIIHSLGTTTFATSTKVAEAQTAFMRGLLLLHLFEYTPAADAFQAAEKLDPGFAMAYWGEAMTFNHGVWNQVNPAAGKAALSKFGPDAAARAARIADPRERAYMASVELLFDGTGTKAERDARYAKAMEKLAASYPGDRNAQLFYALALISQSEGVRDVPVYLRAAGISKDIFRLEPDNPGAAHYWIHGMDDPDHAAGALEAARALSKIAPDASHAQHMCSHIFMALGMWNDVVQANVEAVRIDDAMEEADGFPPFDCGHYPSWLEYGYFQQGKRRLAQQTVNACRKTDVDAAAWENAHPGTVPYRAKSSAGLHSRVRSALAYMQEASVVESQDWAAAAQLQVDTAKLDAESQAWWHFTLGLSAAERGDLPAAQAELEAMHVKAQAVSAAKDADPETVQTLAVGAQELSGLLQVKQGRADAGVAELRRAVEAYRGMAFAFGPPTTLKPPEELLGEVLLERNDAAGARAAFMLSLERAPRRTLSLLGLARAQLLAGDKPAARASYRTLLEIWHDADADTPGLAEARKASTS